MKGPWGGRGTAQTGPWRRLSWSISRSACSTAAPTPARRCRLSPAANAVRLHRHPGRSARWPRHLALAADAGGWIVAASLGGALVFGLINHFIIAGPDHVAHVAAEWRTLFGVTAALLFVPKPRARRSACGPRCAPSGGHHEHLSCRRFRSDRRPARARARRRRTPGHGDDAVGRERTDAARARGHAGRGRRAGRRGAPPRRGRRRARRT